MPNFGRNSPVTGMETQKTVSDMTQPVAVLVDGDNISGKNAASILGIAMKHGDPVVVRAYLDAQRASDWHGAIGYRLIHAGSGKNATDILLAIDAMDLVHSKAAMCFIIATSDGDFTHLAVRLRELGARVIGIGEAKATRMFRASCSSFVELGAQPTVKLVPKVPTGVTELDLKPVYPSFTRSSCNCFDVRRCLRDFPASVFSQPDSFAAKGSSLLGLSATLNSGSTAPDRKYLRMVLRDNFVRRAISRMDRCSRNAQRRIILKNAMPITPISPAASSQGEGVTWVSSQ